MGRQMAAEIIVHPATVEEAEAEAERREELPRLWKAIEDNTRSDASFWLGEILLSMITQETGYAGPYLKVRQRNEQ